MLYIDGIPLEYYGAKLLDFVPGFPSLTNTVLEGKNYALPRLLRSEIAPKPLTLKVTIRQPFTVNGITLTSIPNGAKIVIDGIEKAITQNGANKFAESNLIDFPRFDPNNPDVIITMSQYIPMTISYYPTYM